MNSKREDYLASFKAGVFSQVIPWRLTNYIDGLYHHSMLYGAARMAGDIEVADKAKQWIETLLSLGDVRNFANQQLTPSWIFTDGYWVHSKPQSFAGPAALYWAGNIESPYDPIPRAKLLISLGWLFGHAVKWIDLLNQHVNSFFMAYLMLGHRPPQSMRWLAYDNPLYLYIYGVKHHSIFPFRRATNGTVIKRVEVPFKDREPTMWPAKNSPYKYYYREGTEVDWEYVPICELTCNYLMETL